MAEQVKPNEGSMFYNARPAESEGWRKDWEKMNQESLLKIYNNGMITEEAFMQLLDKLKKGL